MGLVQKTQSPPAKGETIQFTLQGKWGRPHDWYAGNTVDREITLHLPVVPTTVTWGTTGFQSKRVVHVPKVVSTRIYEGLCAVLKTWTRKSLIEAKHDRAGEDSISMVLDYIGARQILRMTTPDGEVARFEVTGCESATLEGGEVHYE